MNGFKQVSFERYWEMLEVLPPATMTGRGFLVGEPVRHDEKGNPLFLAFVRTGWLENEKFFESLEPMTVRAFRALRIDDGKQTSQAEE